MFRKTGNRFPRGLGADEPYAVAIADALRTELGESHRATKTLMRWTGASDRTAKNWLTGSFGPSGEHLLMLARESDSVLATVLALAGRHQHLVGAELLRIRQSLLSALELIDRLLNLDRANGTPD
ncbi:hypothetical protein E2493_14975 [Sphingomonas parva]|uniref:XRE family transcriptional regulator n=1 Tax=Sphingomonas parva TaxID=2555898 RepID=A0A4Y8ZQU5_9SPHN|nr:hypothetical protein E2493_14975 [Sphingomonas parva]